MDGCWWWGKGGRYERKVDLPHEGSPRRRMRTVGGESIGGGFASGHCESAETAMGLSSFGDPVFVGGSANLP